MLHEMTRKINKLAMYIKKLLHKLFELVNGFPRIGKHVINCVSEASVDARSIDDPQRLSKCLKKT